MQVGFVGVGHMGRPILDRIVAAGFPVAAFVRRPELADELREAGVVVLPSMEELAGSVDVLCACTFSDEQLQRVVLGEGPGEGALGSMRPGSALVSHVTGSPALVEQMAAVAPAGVRIVDAPMSGVPEEIRAGTLTLLVGAEAADLERVRPVLASYADPIIHVGRVGDGQRTKLVNNLLFTVHVRCAVEALELGGSLGIAPAMVVEALGQCSGASRALSLFGSRPVAEMLEGARPYLAKDVGVIREVAANGGIDLGQLGDLARWVEGG